MARLASAGVGEAAMPASCWREVWAKVGRVKRVVPVRVRRGSMLLIFIVKV